MRNNNKKKVLFFGEIFTASHYLRPLALANLLDKNKYDIYFACQHKKDTIQLKINSNIHWIELKTSVTPLQFEEAIKNHRHPQSPQIIEQNILEDIEVINKICPDVVIGDHKISLGISCPFLEMPLISLSNIFWTKYDKEKFITCPDMEKFEFLPKQLSSLLFKILFPIISKRTLKTINSFKKNYHQEPYYSLDQSYAPGSTIFFMDFHSLFENQKMDCNHKVIGPVIPKLTEEHQHWINQLNTDKKIIYVSMGSSGNHEHLTKILDTLKEIDATIIVSSSKINLQHNLPKNYVIKNYLIPTHLILPKADLVISHGGSPVIYEALCNRVPSIGIPSNLDQWLGIMQFNKLGLAVLVSPRDLKKGKLSHVVEDILKNQKIKSNIQHFMNNEKKSTSLFEQEIDNFFISQ